MKRLNIPKNLLEELYVKRGLSSVEIAKQLGVSAVVIRRRLHEYDIPMRTWADYFRVEIPSDELRRLYWDENLSPDEIAWQYDCAPETVLNRIHEAGIPLKPLGWRQSRSYVPSQTLSSWPSPELAYVVGLIASDGNLHRNRNTVHFASTDREMIDNYIRLLNLDDINIMIKHTSTKDQYIVEFADSTYREFLETRGLTPNKSKTIAALDIPNSVFADFARGDLDGDGWWSMEKSRGCLSLEGGFSSGSPVFLDWMRDTIHRLTDLNGHITSIRLRYRGQNAFRLGEWLYYQSDLPCLRRKRAIWANCLQQYR